MNGHQVLFVTFINTAESDFFDQYQEKSSKGKADTDGTVEEFTILLYQTANYASIFLLDDGSGHTKKEINLENAIPAQHVFTTPVSFIE